MFCNRFTETSKLEQERKAGKAVFAKVGRRERVWVCVQAAHMRDAHMCMCARDHTHTHTYAHTHKHTHTCTRTRTCISQFGDQEGRRGLFVALLEVLKSKAGIIDTSRGTGTANTSLVFHADRLLALHEGDLPYQVRMRMAHQPGVCGMDACAPKSIGEL